MPGFLGVGVHWSVDFLVACLDGTEEGRSGRHWYGCSREASHDVIMGGE